MRVLRVLPASALALGLVACGSGSSRGGFDDPSASSSGSSGASSGGNSASGGLGGGGASSSSGATAPPGVTLLYAHTDTTLYQADPDHLDQPLQNVGDFDCLTSGASMTDIAVTKDGKLYGVSEGAAYPLTIMGSTVHCDATWALPKTQFYGLTVAPENTVASAEVLIAADGNGGLWQIDPNSGTPTQVGTLGTDPKSGQAWALSGDIVFLANGGNPLGFATVRTCGKSSSCSSNDTLIEVDVTAIKPGTQSVMKAVRGPVVRGSWCTNNASPPSFGSMFGIIAYQDKVYGFSRAGDIVEIHNADGTGCLVASDPTQKYAGAGITTTAPVIAPPAVN